MTEPETTHAHALDDEQPPGRIGRRRLAQICAQLSDRDVAILRTVADLHIVTTRQLQRLHFNHASSTPLAAARATQRSVARLAGLGLLDRPERQRGGEGGGSAAQLWRLSYSGTRLVGDTGRHGAHEPSLTHLAHVLEVGELVVRLHERARSGAMTVLAVETEPTCWRSYVTPYGHQLTLKPDLRLTLGIGNDELHWFIELDRNTEAPTTLVRKITRYLHAWHDGAEEARTGAFPGVLWVVPDQRRAATLEELCASTPGVPDGMYTVAVRHAAIDVLASWRPGDLEAIDHHPAEHPGSSDPWTGTQIWTPRTEIGHIIVAGRESNRE